MDDVAIETNRLTKRYGDTVALSSLSLSIPFGTVYGFLGPNGAGKTTTMRLLSSMTTPTAGTATVAGVPIDNRRSLTERIGYLPAEPPLFPELTGREQLHYVARLHGLNGDDTANRINSLFDRFGLLEDADQRIESYSTGMRKKVGVIATILHEPAVVLLDEPTTGLDPRATRQVRDTIADLAAEDRCVVLSTHILPVVDELADRIGVVHEGELLVDGPPAELKRTADAGDQSTLERAFLEITTENDAG